MTLILKRPLAIFDLETTGVNVALDRIVEISILKAMPDGTEEVKTLRLNPEMPIPIESSMVHGIYDEHIADAPTFRDVANEIAEFIGDADLAGFNSNRFDIPVLMEEFLRVDHPFDIENRFFVDVQNIFHQMEQRTLKAAFRFYCDGDLENAHSAEADVAATYAVLKAQVARYEGQEWQNKAGEKSIPVKNDIEALHEFTNLNKVVDFAGRIVYNKKGVEVFSFGKHKDKPVEEVFKTEPSYYSWMMQGDFPKYTKKCLEKIWLRSRQSQKTNPQTPVSVTPTQSRTTIEDQKNSNVPRSKPNFAPKGNPNQRPQPRPSSKPKAITTDMLESLKDKFKK
jgi:DNA polymerase-3 subunit epsilon